MQGARARKLILHIGAHKTGTTAVQEYLFAKSGLLEERGWFLAHITGKPLNWGHMFRVVLGPRQKGETIFPANPLIQATLLEAIDATPLDVILSSEDLFFLNAEGIADFAPALRQRFDDITVVAYLRRQDKMALSQWLQGGRTIQSAMVFGGSLPPFDNMGAEAMVYLDYATKIEAWEAAFPGARMVLRPYDRALFLNGNVIEDFLALAGIEMEVESRLPDFNRALGSNTVRLVYMLREAGIGQRHIAAGFAKEVFRDKGVQVQPSAAEARAFLERFTESNARLAARMGMDQVFDDDMSAYPPEASFPPLDPDYVQSTLLRLYIEAARVIDPKEVNEPMTEDDTPEAAEPPIALRA